MYMRATRSIISIFLFNAIALWLAQHFLTGFNINHNIIEFSEVVVIFSLINMIVRPIVKTFLGPLIILTLGIGIIVVNALMVYLLSWILPNIVHISGLYVLIYATLIISFTNIVLHIFFRTRKHN